MWQLLGFGRIDTPARHYAVRDSGGQVHWAGNTVKGAMMFIADHRLEPMMERNAGGDAFVRERPGPCVPRPGFLLFDE